MEGVEENRPKKTREQFLAMSSEEREALLDQEYADLLLALMTQNLDEPTRERDPGEPEPPVTS